jgi:hypothetical protein
MFELKIEGSGDPPIAVPTAVLLPWGNGAPGPALSAEFTSGQFLFSGLTPGAYLLSLRYQLAQRHFDSFYFQLDIPDITLIRLHFRAEGAQIEQMGFINPQGEFVDMLVYQANKPFLTFALEQYPFLEALTEFMTYRFAQLAPPEVRQRLHGLIGDLAGALPMLSVLWPWQLRLLLAPPLLAQTSVEWKGILMHLLRNNLILVDDERLYENVQEAVALAQEEDRFGQLLALMEWDPDTQTWHDYPAFLAALTGKTLLRPPRQ